MEFCNGITSACAEKILLQGKTSSCGWDHLRLRGKNSPSLITVSIILGSPPLARKKFCHIPAESSVIRITSACAEKIHILIAFHQKYEDHLRLRGKNTKKSCKNSYSLCKIFKNLFTFVESW